MLSKLSIRNVKRSFSDYGIYFLTLTLGVSFFYSFNSIEAQKFMLDLSTNQEDLIDHMLSLLTWVSVFVSFILAFLILYANQFLLKRRKKELGVYKTLGMSKWNISKLFLMETLVVGIFSLISGLVLGALISQGFSVLASSVFDADLINYKFVISIDAVKKTVVFFSVIFIVVIIFNTMIISKFTLLELLHGSKKNENVKVKNPKVGFIIFIISVMLIVASYAGLLHFGISEGLLYVAIFIVMAIAGTFLFFFSVSSFLLSIIQSKKSFYFKNLNIFLVRQVSSKINTNFMIMALICIMLTGSITVLSGGFGYKKAMDEELKIVSPYDVTIFGLLWEENLPEKPSDIEKFLEYKGISLDDFEEYVSLYYYDAMLSPIELIRPYISEFKYSQYSNSSDALQTYAISQTEYKKLVEMQDIKSIDMKEDEVIIFSNMVNMIDGVQSFMDNNESISINNKEYKFANEKAQLLSIENTEVPRIMMMAVLPDKDVKKLNAVGELFSASYKENDTTMNDKLTQIYDDLVYGSIEEDAGGGLVDLSQEDSSIPNEYLPYTKTYVYETSQGFTGSVIFIGIYVGTIFLVSSAAILTLQQLSEASDNLSRYKTLKSIGVGQKSIYKAIFSQIFIYFMAPLVIAISHSVVAIVVINNIAISSSSWSILVPALVGALVLTIIYGTYFFLTYKTYKSIVK